MGKNSLQEHKQSLKHVNKIFSCVIHLLQNFLIITYRGILRKIGIPLPSAATWRMHLKLRLNGCPFRPKFEREALTKLLYFARPALSAHVLHMFAPLALLA